MELSLREKTQLSRLVAQHWERFYRYALRLCQGNHDDAEDLLSETLIDLHRDFPRYRGDHFDRWGFRILTTNRIDMARRYRHRRTESLDSLFGEVGGWDAPDFRPSIERQVTADLYSEELEKALAELPEVFRTPLLLCDVEGMDYAQIAEKIGVPLGTIRSRIHRARLRVRAALPNPWE